MISNPTEKAHIFNKQLAKKASIEGLDDPVPNVPVKENITDSEIVKCIQPIQQMNALKTQL